MSIIRDFIKEHDEITRGSFAEDVAEEIHRVEKIVSNPKLRPPAELKEFFQKIRDEIERPLVIALVGDNNPNKIVLINLISGTASLPVDPRVAQKVLNVQYSHSSFAVATHNGEKMVIDVSNCSPDLINKVEKVDVYINCDFLKDFDIIKTGEVIDKECVDMCRNSDILLWIVDIDTQIRRSPEYERIFKKKPVVCVLTKTEKIKSEEALLEKVSNMKSTLDSVYGIKRVFDLGLNRMFMELKIGERLTIISNANIIKRLCSRAIESPSENIQSALDNLRSIATSLITDDKNTESGMPYKLKDIQDDLNRLYGGAKLKRKEAVLRELVEKIKVMEKKYKSMLDHYKRLYSTYSTKSDLIVTENNSLVTYCESKLRGNIAKSIREYLHSMADSIIDNIDTTTIRVKDSATLIKSIFDKYKTVKIYKVNKIDAIREAEDSRSVLFRKHKEAITKVDGLSSYVQGNVNKGLDELHAELESWIRVSHDMVLQKRPSFIGADNFHAMQEFGLNISMNLTKDYRKMIEETKSKISLEIVEIKAWLGSTQKIMLDSVVNKVQDKLQENEKHDSKKREASGGIKSQDVFEIILSILPDNIRELVGEKRVKEKDTRSLGDALQAEQIEHKKNIHSKIREVAALHKLVKEAIKFLEVSIKSVKEQSHVTR